MENSYKTGHSYKYFLNGDKVTYTQLAELLGKPTINEFKKRAIEAALIPLPFRTATPCGIVGIEVTFTRKG